MGGATQSKSHPLRGGIFSSLPHPNLCRYKYQEEIQRTIKKMLHNSPQVRMALANTTIVGPRALAREADRFVLAMPQQSPDLLAPAVAPPPDRRRRAKDGARPSG
ncbi:unnamed protein product [Boreogadus saida]